MKKLMVCVVTILWSCAAFAGESLHVTNVRDWTPTDPAPVSRAFKVQVVVGTVGATKYTTQQLCSWGTQRLEPGKDYEVIKRDARAIMVLTHDKKGREAKERLDVTGAESVE